MAGGSGAAHAATTQNFNTPGTPYVASACSAVAAPVILAGGPGGTGNFMRLVRAGDASGRNSVALAASDRGGFTTITAEFDFRITPAGPTNKADGMSFIPLDTAQNDVTGGTCQGAEEANAPGALGVGFDVYQNPSDGSANEVSIHFNNAVVAQLSAGAVNLSSGQWIHARIVVRPGGGLSNVSVFCTPTGGAEATIVSNQAVAGLLPFESRGYFGARTGGQSAHHDVTNISIAYAGDPAVVGQWSAVTNLPVIPIHSVMLPNQKILFWDRASAGTDIIPRLLNTDGTVVHPHPVFELFCAGQSLDAQGRTMILGGHDGADGYGLATTFAYDYATNTFTSHAAMNAGRWYPTNTTMANGDTLRHRRQHHARGEQQRPAGVRGQDRDLPHPGPPTSPGRAALPDDVPGARRAHVQRRAQPERGVPEHGRDRDLVRGDQQPRFAGRDYGAAVMYDAGKVALIGGGYITNTVERIDLNRPARPGRSPRRWRSRAARSMRSSLPTATSWSPAAPRPRCSTTTPGRSSPRRPGDPLANTWSMGAAAAVSRLYHSETVLLPDGRVASLGGGHPGGANGGPNNFNMEYYSPSYLFKGARPDGDRLAAKRRARPDRLRGHAGRRHDHQGAHHPAGRDHARL